MHRRIKSYQDATEFLFSRINYEKQPARHMSSGDFHLERMRLLLQRLDNPQAGLPVVHIAGTKGKGSTAVKIAAVLQAAGLRTGLFTSPHINRFEERFQVDGVMPTEAELTELVDRVELAVAELDQLPGELAPTYFEIATALGWLYYRKKQAEIVVLEVGMGGRLDSTNLCDPAVCVITSISRDHTRQLGSFVEQIAAEKGGIIKPGIPVVSGVLDPQAQAVIQQIADQKGAQFTQLGRDFSYDYHVGPAIDLRRCAAGQNDSSELIANGTWFDFVDIRGDDWEVNQVPLKLWGEHQARNVAVAIAAVKQLQSLGWTIPDSAISVGLSRVRWPGRIEIVQQHPLVVVDGAHNWAAVNALVSTLNQRIYAEKRVLIFAATRDKDVTGMLRLLLPHFDTIILTEFHNNPRAMPIADLMQLLCSLTARGFHMASTTEAAWQMAQQLAGRSDFICVTGSFFVAAEFRELLPGLVNRA